MAKDGDYATLRLPSSEMRMVHLDCRATVGQIGNVTHENITIGKAGRSRWKGKRPKVRGSAMNPVDHPHGGGEGKSNSGRHPVTPWGKPTHGYRTRPKGKKSTSTSSAAASAASTRKGARNGPLAQEGPVRRPEAPQAHRGR